MFKIFTLAAAIAILPLSNKVSNANLVENTSWETSAYSFNFKNTVTANPFVPEKKAAEDWSQNWQETAQEDIRKSEYHFTWEQKLNAYCTPNRKNNFLFFMMIRALPLSHVLHKYLSVILIRQKGQMK